MGVWGGMWGWGGRCEVGCGVKDGNYRQVGLEVVGWDVGLGVEMWGGREMWGWMWGCGAGCEAEMGDG